MRTGPRQHPGPRKKALREAVRGRGRGPSRGTRGVWAGWVAAFNFGLQACRLFYLIIYAIGPPPPDCTIGDFDQLKVVGPQAWLAA